MRAKQTNSRLWGLQLLVSCIKNVLNERGTRKFEQLVKLPVLQIGFRWAHNAVYPERTMPKNMHVSWTLDFDSNTRFLFVAVSQPQFGVAAETVKCWRFPNCSFCARTWLVQVWRPGTRQYEQALRRGWRSSAHRLARNER